MTSKEPIKVLQAPPNLHIKIVQGVEYKKSNCTLIYLDEI